MKFTTLIPTSWNDGTAVSLNQLCVSKLVAQLRAVV